MAAANPLSSPPREPRGLDSLSILADSCIASAEKDRLLLSLLGSAAKAEPAPAKTNLFPGLGAEEAGENDSRSSQSSRRNGSNDENELDDNFRNRRPSAQARLARQQRTAQELTDSDDAALLALFHCTPGHERPLNLVSPSASALKVAADGLRSFTPFLALFEPQQAEAPAEESSTQIASFAERMNELMASSSHEEAESPRKRQRLSAASPLVARVAEVIQAEAAVGALLQLQSNPR